jgi:predicted ATPase/DNA-binding winged helix-turn-helix (wHTH) protein
MPFRSHGVEDYAMEGPEAQTRDVIEFGPFRLVRRERLLTRAGAPVELGGRTLDTLIALVSRPNEIIGKRDLITQVWPDVSVDEGSLRFHIASLRKALGDGKDGARYIATLAGRGYCFVAPIAQSDARTPLHAPAAVNFQHANLPTRLTRMIGRDEGVLLLSSQLEAVRFVTIVGAGGVGKTTVAVAVGHELIRTFAGAVLFLDFGALNDPGLAATSLASMLGLSVQSDDPIPSLIAYLKDRRMLLILDNCEHLIEAVAALTERIFAAAPQVHILATSREALRVEGEQVHRLAPLALPPDDPGLTAAVALAFPATQMFVERVVAHGANFDLTDSNAAIVAGICRRLDGVPLAIELAAGRVEAYGLELTAALLDQRLARLWLGQRTAPPRQKTLQATLDWSFELLSGLERTVLRRLSVFVGFFTLEAAIAVVTSDTIDKGLVVGAIDSLVAKSMVATRPLGATVRYRLLDTTRGYARDIDVEDAERAELAMRHATYFRQWLQRAGADWPTLSTATQRAPHLAALANVRAALEWCFGVNGNAAAGIELAAAAAPIFLLMSLLTECHRWSERALLALGDTKCLGLHEMYLQTALGLSMMFTKGNSEDVRVALARGLELAEQCGDLRHQLQLLGGLHLFHERIGEFSTSLPFAERSEVVSRAIDDPVAIAAAHSWLGISHHLMGNVEVAHSHLQTALASPRVSESFNTIQIGFEYHNRGHITLARNLWLRGYPDQAAEVARQTVEEAAGLGHPVTLCMALIWAVTVFAWRRDWTDVEENIERFIAHADRYSLAPYHAAGVGVKGELALRRGELGYGIQLLLRGLNALHAGRYELLTTELVSALSEGLALTGEFEEALTTIERAIEQAELHGRYFTMPELLRIKAEILTTMPGSDRRAAEACLLQSLEMSRRQGARAWDLRTSVDLATLWAAEERPEDARTLLRPVFAQFTEGFDTVDLKAAARVLETLG